MGIAEKNATKGNSFILPQKKKEKKIKLKCMPEEQKSLPVSEIKAAALPLLSSMGKKKENFLHLSNQSTRGKSMLFICQYASV